MKDNEVIIECKKVKFYASYDEDAFFEWLTKIKSITLVKGKGNSIFLTIKILSNEDLYNLVALLRRYKIKIDELEQHLNKSQQKLLLECKKGHHVNVYPAEPIN